MLHTDTLIGPDPGISIRSPCFIERSTSDLNVADMQHEGSIGPVRRLRHVWRASFAREMQHVARKLVRDERPGIRFLHFVLFLLFSFLFGIPAPCSHGA